GVCVRRYVERYRARPARINAEKILCDTFDLKFNVWSQPNVYSNHARARQVAANARNGKTRALHKIDSDFDTQRAGRNDVDIFGNQRSLLRARNQGEAQSKANAEESLRQFVY